LNKSPVFCFHQRNVLMKIAFIRSKNWIPQLHRPKAFASFGLACIALVASNLHAQEDAGPGAFSGAGGRGGDANQQTAGATTLPSGGEAAIGGMPGMEASPPMTIDQARQVLADESTDEARKQAAREFIAKQVLDAFDRDMAEKAKQLAELQGRLEKMKRLMQKKASNRQRIIDLQVMMIEAEATGMGVNLQSREPGGDLFGAGGAGGPVNPFGNADGGGSGGPGGPFNPFGGGGGMGRESTNPFDDAGENDGRSGPGTGAKFKTGGTAGMPGAADDPFSGGNSGGVGFDESLEQRTNANQQRESSGNGLPGGGNPNGGESGGGASSF
jgi:hypothetical protein